MILSRRDNAYCLHSKHIVSGILLLTFISILLRLVTLWQKKKQLLSPKVASFFIQAVDYCDDFVYQSDEYYTYNDYLYQLNKKNEPLNKFTLLMKVFTSTYTPFGCFKGGGGTKIPPP